MVLAFDSKIHKLLQFLLLDAFHLDTLVLDALANLSSFLKVIQALLLLVFRIHADLVTNQLKEKQSNGSAWNLAVRKIELTESFERAI